MNNLKAGYASVNINPDGCGIAIEGYYVPRYAKGILDELTLSALALFDGVKKIILLSIDNCYIKHELVQKFVKEIESKTGLSSENIFFTATHSHTAPCISHCEFFPADDEPIEKYFDFLLKQSVVACEMALADLKNAKMGYGTVTAPEKIAFIRRYKMKDGSIMTCPPIDDNIDYPIGELDQRIHVVRFDRENAESIVLLNYGLHADTIGGDMLSADWIHWTKKTLDLALGGVKCICLIGAQGDVGSTNVHPEPGDMNDTEISFDNEMKSPGMARFVGRALAGAVLQIYDKVAYMDVDKIDIIHKTLVVDANVPKPEDMPKAREYKKLHDDGRDDLIPYEAMELTTVVAEALRMCKMEHGPKTFDLHMVGLKIGDVAFVGIPGEPFTDIGVEIKKAPGWKLVMPVALTNGYEGYFPVKSAFDEGGYEARTSPFTSSIAADIVSASNEILEKLK